MPPLLLEEDVLAAVQEAFHVPSEQSVTAEVVAVAVGVVSVAGKFSWRQEESAAASNRAHRIG